MAEAWGTMSVNGICRKLNRSRNAIMVRVNRMGLPPYFESGEYVTMHQLILSLGYGASDSYKVKSWIQNREFPVKTKRHSQKVVRVVYLDEFWKWAEKNRSFLNFSRMEPLALGEEPEWVATQRKKDAKTFSLQRKDPWSPGDDHLLQRLLQEHKYGYAELSAMLHRSAGAILRRCRDLGLKERPLAADNHGEECKWTEQDYLLLAEGIRNGDSYTAIGNAIGKSEKAVRGKVYFVYLTENADKVRAYMGNGPWGAGAPEPTVKQARHLSRTRTETTALLENLAGVLYRRVRELKKSDYDCYFQRAMCMNWDELQSVCTAGCEDCDACPQFRRIQPQYCVRCGKTFYERQENRCCAQCRVARKRQAQRKWKKLQGVLQDGRKE